MLTKTYLFVLALVGGLFGFELTAHAATAIDPPTGNGVGLAAAQAVYNAFTGGHYAYAACMALVVAVALTRKYLGDRWAVLHTDAGSAVLVLLGSFGTTMVAALTGGGAVSLHLVWTSLGIAFVSAGGYAALKSIVIVPLLPKLPAWVQPVVGYLFFHESDTSGNSKPDQPVPSA